MFHFYQAIIVRNDSFIDFISPVLLVVNVGDGMPGTLDVFAREHGSWDS